MSRVVNDFNSVFKYVNKLDNGCWEFTGARVGKRNEYGKITINRKTYRAHIVAYLVAKGEVIVGYHVAHLCHNSICINPLHLELQTPRVNILDSNGVSAINSRKTHCPKGHEYNKNNTMITGQGRRVCKVCRKTYYSTYIRK